MQLLYNATNILGKYYSGFFILSETILNYGAQMLWGNILSNYFANNYFVGKIYFPNICSISYASWDSDRLDSIECRKPTY